ncbi:HD family hydrolase [Alphaproteobacteria bacterium]|nr:HD family hydrolase [Alphaproteobacteria bacterium]
MKEKKNRAWQRMLSGRKLDILSPSPLDIEIEDIALGLSRVTRWNGQTIGVHAYSVAQHSILVEKIFANEYPNLKNKWKLAALLHDAPEYVIGDLITPFKYALNNSYREVEENLMKAIYIRFGLPPITPKSIELKIKRVDKAVAWYEAISIGGYTAKEAMQILKKPDLKFTNKAIIPLSPDTTAEKFLKKFNEIILSID